jgi:hypothetical protein
MRQLHGVIRSGCSQEQLKRQAIMFDRFYVAHIDYGFELPEDPERLAEWEFPVGVAPCHIRAMPGQSASVARLGERCATTRGLCC